MKSIFIIKIDSNRKYTILAKKVPFRMIDRLQKENILQWMGKKKAIIIIGPRQVGETTLTRQISDEMLLKKLWLTGDDPATRDLLKNISLARLKTVLGSHELIIVDEAQRLHNAGLMLKLITDHFPKMQLMVTGSSTLNLAAETKES